MDSRLRKIYKEEIVKDFMDNKGYSNIMAVPKIEKIVLNMGVGEAAIDKKKIDAPYNEMMMISGQKPVLCKAKKSIAAFKLRDGMNIGCKVTLRNYKMYEFLDRLVNVAMPRIRDFRGLPATRGFDGNGNYSMSIKEQIVFPEVDYNKVDKIRGMNITICTSAKNNQDLKYLLQKFNFPFMG